VKKVEQKKNEGKMEEEVYTAPLMASEEQEKLINVKKK
jgi:hypothetical protein